ncbi:MAG: hypothetical protein K1X79_09650 [Oligoflexia bacterium]|nr:hypothetical protein [Oligoflexia bacterium]
MKNWALKLFSLLIAILLSMFVSSEGNSSVLSFFVNVEIKNIPAHKTVVAPQSRQVQVSLRGPSFLVSRIAASPPTFKVRLPGDVDERYMAQLSKGDLGLPPDVVVVSIEPPELELQLDDVVTKDVPVVIPKIGTVADGLKLDEIRVSPDSIKVTGPAKQLRTLRSIESEPLDLTGSRATFSRELVLRAVGAQVEFERTAVQVEGVVSPVQQQRRFEHLALEVRVVSGEKWVSVPRLVDVEVSGPKDAIARLKPNDIIVFVRPNNEGPDSQEVKVGAELPDAVSATVVSPSLVTVQRFKEPVAGGKRAMPAKPGR